MSTLCYTPEFDTLEAGLEKVDTWAAFTVHPDGHVTQRLELDAPEVYLDADEDGQVAGEPEDTQEWYFLAGHTGQYSYNGAIMHSSEYLGGNLAAHLLWMAQDAEGPQTFVCVAVEVITPDGERDETPAGWAIAHYIGTEV